MKAQKKRIIKFRGTHGEQNNTQLAQNPLKRDTYMKFCVKKSLPFPGVKDMQYLMCPENLPKEQLELRNRYLIIYQKGEAEPMVQALNYQDY